MSQNCTCRWCGVKFRCYDGYNNWTDEVYEYRSYCSKKCGDADGRKMEKS